MHDNPISELASTTHKGCLKRRWFVFHLGGEKPAAIGFAAARSSSRRLPVRAGTSSRGVALRTGRRDGYTGLVESRLSKRGSLGVWSRVALKHEDQGQQSFTLDDLSAAYARALVESGLIPTGVSAGQTVGEPEPADAAKESAESPAQGEEETGVNPQMIVEAALFVGHPENIPLTAAQIAGTMRGVSAAEVERCVSQLNEEYRSGGHPLEIQQRGRGYSLGLQASFRDLKNQFYGKVRETRLNQGAIDCLALVAYQPGITLAELARQRGKDPSSTINQLVRRELVLMRREVRGEGKKVATYYPAPRLLQVLGLQSLEDLPVVDEVDAAPRGALPLENRQRSSESVFPRPVLGTLRASTDSPPKTGN